MSLYKHLQYCLMIMGLTVALVMAAFNRGSAWGIMQSDQEAFDSYVYFARQMHPKPHKNAQESVFVVVDRHE